MEEKMLIPEGPRRYNNVEGTMYRVGATLRNLFKTKEKTVHTTTVTAITTTVKEPEPALYVGNILVNDTVAFDTDLFNQIYNQVPELLCVSYSSALERFRILFGNLNPTMSYEEILKLYMDMSAKASELEGIDVLRGLNVRCLNELFDEISIPNPGTQTIVLSFIWASMIYDLESKRSCSPSESEKNKIIKTCIGLLGFASQVFHREIPLWKWIGTVYKVFTKAGDCIKNSPYLYRNLYLKLFPDKDIDITRFPNWHKELEKYIDRDDKITIGKAFNISYTFRVGDIYLHSVLNNSSYFDDELKERLIDSLSPVPKERDLMRIFDLYTKPSIY